MESMLCKTRPSKPTPNCTYLIELSGQGTIGLLHGNYLLVGELPGAAESLDIALPEKDIHLERFVNTSEEDELAEFRILNYKDRVIVRSVEEDKMVLFGTRRMDRSCEFVGLDTGGTLVVRGPVTIQHIVHKNEDEDDADLEEDTKLSDRAAIGGDCCEPKVQLVKYSGHVTLNISGFAYIDTANWRQGVKIVLPSESKFSVERTIPHRFQQKTVVQRQKEKFQSTQGMMSLETFTHLRI